MSAFGLNFQLGETTDALRDSVHQFCAKEIAPRAADFDPDNAFIKRTSAIVRQS